MNRFSVGFQFGMVLCCKEILLGGICGLSAYFNEFGMFVNFSLKSLLVSIFDLSQLHLTKVSCNGVN